MVKNKIVRKKRIVTGITPTGTLTIGNYLGSIKNLVKMQNKYEMFVFVANLHALTQISTNYNFDNKKLKNNTYDVLALFLACGINPKNVNLFIQSEILEHTFFSFILECSSTIGKLKRMTQFKSKSEMMTKKGGISTALLTYPCLMSADILLYQPDYIPVGVDQKQHIELCRDLAIFLNKKFNLKLKLPKEYIDKISSKILSLINPQKKMSKSSNDEKSYISLLDAQENVEKKIKSALTDSENKIYYDPKNKPGISNLMVIYSGISNVTMAKLKRKYNNKNYNEFKNDLIKIINIFLKKIQAKFKFYRQEKNINKIIEAGRKKAKSEAKKIVQQIKEKIGI